VYPEAPGFWRGLHLGVPLRRPARLLGRFPEAEGLLWTNDDVVINYWNFLGANKSKLWLPNNSNKLEYSYYNLFPNGTGPVRTDWPAGSVYQKQAQGALLSLPETVPATVLRVDAWDAGVPQACGRPILYPKPPLQKLPRDSHPKVFGAGLISELAIPMAFLAAEAPQEWDPILNDMEYNWELMWRTNLSYDPRDHWHPRTSGVPPVEGGDGESEEAAAESDSCGGSRY